MVWKPIKCILRPTALFTNVTKLNGPFSFHCVTLYCFNDVNLTISPLDSSIYKGGFHEDVTYQHPLFVNNSNNNHYCTNYSTNSRSVSTNDQLNSKANHLINNSINDGDLPNSETAPLIIMTYLPHAVKSISHKIIVAKNKVVSLYAYICVPSTIFQENILVIYPSN